jgi:hypothetical protein
MLMTKYSFNVGVKEDGAYITVTKLENGETKEFFQAGIKDPAGLDRFMNSITDELAASYFPKPRKEKEQKNG